MISEREDSRGRVSIKTRCDILSRRFAVQMFAGVVRGHWVIENNLHWQRDVSFRDDECRGSRDHSPANLSVIRRIALGLLNRAKSCRKGIAIKRETLSVPPTNLSQTGWSGLLTIAGAGATVVGIVRCV